MAGNAARSSWVLSISGTVLLAGAVAACALAPRHTAVAFLIGVLGVLCIAIAVGAPLRRPGPPRGPHWLLIGSGTAAMVVAGLVTTLPPHSYGIGTLFLVLGAGLFCIGVGFLGGGWFGIIGAVAAGLLGAALVIAPTPLALARVGVPEHCSIPAADGYELPDGFTVYDFTAVCPDGHRYPFPNTHERVFPGRRVTVLVDPHGVLAPEFAGEHDPGEDLPAAIASVLLPAAVVAAAAINRALRRGRVRPVVKPPITT